MSNTREHIIYGAKLNNSNLKFSNLGLGTSLYDNLTANGREIAQIDAITGQHQTFDDINHSSCVMAQNLKRRGYKSNDVISIISENRLEYTVPVIASLYIGTICAPLNPLYTEDELVHGLNIGKPKLIFCSALTLNTVSKAVKRCHLVKEIILFDDISHEININCNISSYSELIHPAHTLVRTDCFIPDQFDSHQQTAVILYSSGTSGLPKGVELTHFNIEMSLKTTKRLISFNEQKEVVLALLPFFHGFGYIISLTSIMECSKLIILKNFEEKLFLSSIEKYKVTFLPLAPPLIIFLAKSPEVDKYDLSSVKDILSGAAPCGEDVMLQVVERLGKSRVEIRQGYGMTEISICIALSPRGSKKYQSVGILVDEAEGKVVDLKTGISLGPYEVGELCFRGPHIMKGYYNNKSETEETIDSEGWLHSGDIGYYDKEGYLYINDRIKELIKYKGYQVAPAEIEAFLLTHPGVRDVAVIGIPDEISGELPRAYIVKQPGAKVNEKDIIRFVASKLSKQKQLKGGVEFVDSIPKNPSGKILRKVLRAQIKCKL